MGGASARLERGGFLCKVLLEENLLPFVQKMFLSEDLVLQQDRSSVRSIKVWMEEQKMNQPEPSPDPEPHSEPWECDQEDGGSPESMRAGVKSQGSSTKS